MNIITDPKRAEFEAWWLSLSPETRAILHQCTQWRDSLLPKREAFGGGDDAEPFDYADGVARHGELAR